MAHKFNIYSEQEGMFCDEDELRTKEMAIEKAKEYINLYLQSKEDISERDKIYVIEIIAESYLAEADSKKATEARGEVWDYDDNNPIFNVVLKEVS